jgi:tol-pal system protein YbgF
LTATLSYGGEGAQLNSLRRCGRGKSQFRRRQSYATGIAPIGANRVYFIMTRDLRSIRIVLLAALAALSMASPAVAQDRPGFLDNLFNRGQQNQNQEAPPPGPVAQGQPMPGASSDPNDLGVRIDRIENALRTLTGTVEQLQYRNQQLEMQLKRMQDDTEYRLQQLGSKSAPARAQSPGVPMAPAAAPENGRRSDEFDPALHPNAPGVPRTLGNPSIVAPEPAAPVGASNDRPAGQPLDLSTLAGNAGQVPAASVPAAPISNAEPVTTTRQPPPRNVGAAGPRLATLPPSATPQDEYDLAYGYVLHKDYALAEQAFRDFMRKYPDERLVPDAQYWLGESLYQRQRYRDAAEAFLAVSTKYEHAGKAPGSLLRLGQSLAALHQKEAACATLGEVARKYPKAPASVKRGVEQEIKKAHC